MSSVKRKNTDCSLIYIKDSKNTSSCSLKHSTTNDSKFFFNDNEKQKTSSNPIISPKKNTKKIINHSLYPLKLYNTRENSLTIFDFKNSKCNKCSVHLDNIKYMFDDNIVCKSCQSDLYNEKYL